MVSALFLGPSEIHDDFWDVSFFQLFNLLIVGGIGFWVAHTLNTRATNIDRQKGLLGTLIEEYAAKLLSIESQAEVYRDDPSAENRYALTAAARSARQALHDLCSGMDRCIGSLSFNHSTEQLKDLFGELDVISTDQLFEDGGNLPTIFHRLQSKRQQLHNVLVCFRFDLYSGNSSKRRGKE